MSSDPFAIDFVPMVRRFGALSERVAIIVDRQRSLWARHRSAWAVVPWTRGDEVLWLVIAEDSEAERRAREVVAAFVGPGMATIDPLRLPLNPALAPDRQLMDRGIDRAFTLQVGRSPSSVVEALELLVAVRMDEPDLDRPIEDPIGFLLRDFHLSLSARDPESSSSLLRRLEATGLLARENIRFLHVERLARLGRWEEIVDLPWFFDLTRTRRPRHLTEHLLEALWRREFGSAHLIAQAGAALRHFAETDVGNRFKPLLDSVDVPVSVGGRRLVYMASIASGNVARASRILDVVGDDEKILLRQLVEEPPDVARAPVPETPYEKARSMLDEGDFVGVVEYVESSSPDPRLVAVAVRAAFELSDSELASRAAALVLKVGEEKMPNTPGFLRSLHEVKQMASDRCLGWGEWFLRVASDVPWPDAARVARAEAARWDVSELRASSVAESAANQLVSAAEGVNAIQVRGALDLICDLVSGLTESTTSAPLTDALLLVLSIEENPSVLVRNAFFGLLADALSSGPSQARYQDLVKTAGDLWARARSREAVNWVLDVCDLLNANASPDPGARIVFITAVGVGVADLAARLTQHERTVLEALAKEAGTTVSLPAVTDSPIAQAEADLWGALANKLVGLYSLLGGVGPRFSARVMELSADASVEHNADTVATDALRRLATAADYFVVDTRHAAHAATAAIDQGRPRHAQILPSGRGVSSFIAALRDALERGVILPSEPAA